jgi:hypothetical protein
MKSGQHALEQAAKKRQRERGKIAPRKKSKSATSRAGDQVEYYVVWR